MGRGMMWRVGEGVVSLPPYRHRSCDMVGGSALPVLFCGSGVGGDWRGWGGSHLGRARGGLCVVSCAPLVDRSRLELRADDRNRPRLLLGPY